MIYWQRKQLQLGIRAGMAASSSTHSKPSVKQFHTWEMLHVGIHQAAPSQRRLLLNSSCETPNTAWRRSHAGTIYYGADASAQLHSVHSHWHPCTSHPWDSPGMLLHRSIRASGWLSRVHFKEAPGASLGNTAYLLSCTGMGLPTGLWLCLSQDDPLLFPPKVGPPTLSPPSRKALALWANISFPISFFFLLPFKDKQTEEQWKQWCLVFCTFVLIDH